MEKNDKKTKYEFAAVAFTSKARSGLTCPSPRDSTGANYGIFIFLTPALQEDPQPLNRLEIVSKTFPLSPVHTVAPALRIRFLLQETSTPPIVGIGVPPGVGSVVATGASVGAPVSE